MEKTNLGPSNDTDKMQLENELTNKFLSGEMSFAEYSNEWYADEDEEDLEELVKKQDDEHHLSIQNVAGKPVQKRRRRTRLSQALLGLMGEANLRLARGDVEMAERMCLEIIKQLPTAAEPYQTLAQIYENDPDKSLQFSLLAAHLSRPDANEWLRLAAISAKRNDYRQEMICYTHAIKADPQNLDVHLLRLNRLAALDEMKYPLNTLNTSLVKCYHKIVTSMPATKGDIIMKYARLASKVYHKALELEKTVEVFTAAYQKCSTLFTLEDINIYLELLILQKSYQMCIDVFVASLGIEIEAEIQTIKNADGAIEEQTHYLNCCIPDNLAIDLKSKLLVCFIHLGAFNLVETLLSDFLKNDVEKAGDLYMDIEEAFSSVGHHEMAIKLLEPLIKNSNFDLGAVWLKHAECLLKLGRVDDAIESFYKVLKHVPQHPDARRQLFNILERKGNVDEALNILQQDYKYVVSPSLLYEHCQILKKYNKPLKYLEIGEALLKRSLTKFRHEEELRIACRTKGALELIHEFRTLRGENPYHEDDLQFEEEPFKLSPKEEWELLKELLGIAYKNKLYCTMQRLTFSAFLSKGISNRRAELEYLCLQACLLNGDFKHALRFSKELIQKNSTPLTWNLINHTMNVSDENAHNRYVTRLFHKDSNVSRLLLIGNNFLMSGRYIVGLKYFLEYHEQCREPISALLIALSIFAMTSQKFVDRHHNLMLQGLSYLLTYKRLRNCDQEVNYNLGRTYQMLNINNLAIEYYERALKCGPITHCENHGSVDLTKEIAFNLYVLYKDHSPDIARTYMLKYLII